MSGIRWDFSNSGRKVSPATLARGAAISAELVEKANASRQRLAAIRDDDSAGENGAPAVLMTTDRP